MNKDIKIKTPPPFSGENYPTYNRAGRLRSGEFGGTPFNRVLASFRSASETPITEPIKGSPTAERPILSPVATIESLPQERPESLAVQLLPKKLDEPSRNALEDRVRQKKRSRERCPFSGFNGECCRPDIRCGERAQFSGRESDYQQTMPHRCLYTPYFSSDNVIIIEPDLIQREFLLNSFKLFLNYDMEKIATLNSAEQASETLTRYKLQNRMIGLVVVSTVGLGTGVHSFLTELYERNINAEIILLTEGRQEEMTVIQEFRAKMISAKEPFISEVLQVPVHTEKFVNCVSDLHFGKFL